jgi:DNA (cytosine-5)-methyltransferase 1
LGELGYGFAYRVLDAQHFGVAQRRRRVFVVGYLGDWRVAAAVLFESESLQRDSKPSRKKGQETSTDAEGSVGESGKSWWDGGQTAPTLTCSNANGAQRMPDSNNLGAVIEQVAQPIAYSFDSLASNSMKSNNPNSGCREVETSKTIDTANPDPSKNQGGIAVAQPIAVDWRTTQVDVEKTGTLKTDLAKMSGPCIAVDTPTIIDRAAFNQGQNAQYEPRIEEGETMSSLVAKGPHAVQHSMAIRRLTPKECERLQGFPDDWTKIPYRNKPADQCPDGPRYKACGNSMAVPVMRWIGQRIEYVESLIENP